jgi:hypothetical protein
VNVRYDQLVNALAQLSRERYVEQASAAGKEPKADTTGENHRRARDLAHAIIGLNGTRTDRDSLREHLAAISHRSWMETAPDPDRHGGRPQAHDYDRADATIAEIERLEIFRNGTITAPAPPKPA